MPALTRRIPPPPVTITVEVGKDQQLAFLQLVRDFHSGRVRVATPAIDFGDQAYRDAAKDLLNNPSASHALVKRIAEDDARDSLDALTDAEHLHALQSKRFAEAAPIGTVDVPGGNIEQAGVEALKRLFKVARGHSGQCRHIARFLLGLYNGNRFPFDLTDFRCIDERLYDDCMRVLRMDARACKQEVHTYFENGGAQWEAMAENWSVPEVGKLQAIARDVVERQLLSYAGRVADLVDDLKAALRYRKRGDEE